jgi:hypothetical protein
MKFNSFRFLLSLSVIVLLSSCLATNDTTTTTSSDASFVSLTLAGNDSVKTAAFALDATGKIIENIDSLPFRTRIDSVYPTFSFKSTAWAKLHYTKTTAYKFRKDSILLTGKDTVDFRQPMWIRNYATDGIAYKNYDIKVNVHKVHPELYVWNKVTGNLPSINFSSQKAVVFKGQIYYFLNDGANAYLYTSADGYNWSSGSVNGLPANSSLNDITEFNGSLYLSQNGKNIYSSADGINWIKTVKNYTFKSFLYSLNNNLWAVVKLDNESACRFLTYDGSKWDVGDTIPANFPVSDFASLSFLNRTGKQRALLIGGVSAQNNQLKNRWSTEDGVYWVDFSTANHNLDTLAIGSSVISYDNKLLLFGKYTSQNKLFYKESIDEGLSWQIPNIVYNQIALGTEYKSTKTCKDTVSYDAVMRYQPHIYQSAVVDKNSRIFLIGGFMDNLSASVRQAGSQQRSSQNASLTPAADIWTGKLNRKNFLRQ